METCKFRIFGAPTTFNLYKGAGSEIGYFQNFDNGSKENAKLTIHRMASGKVSYSYLRYNFISSGGRPNSFFGMSVLLGNEYFTDVKKLYALFDTIYKNIVLRNGILIAEIGSSGNAQAKYLVGRFEDADAEVRNIEDNVLNNIEKHFAGDILPLDSTFLESGSMMQLNDKAGNAEIIAAMRRCSWVSIAAEYDVKEGVAVPSPDFLAGIDEDIEHVQKRIADVSVRALKKVDVSKDVAGLIRTLEGASRKIREWLQREYPKEQGLAQALQKQPELRQRDGRLGELKKLLDDLAAGVSQAPAGNGARPPISPAPYVPPLPPQPPFPPQPPKTPVWRNPKALAIGAVALLLVVVSLICFPWGKKETEDTKPDPGDTLAATVTSDSQKECAELCDKAVECKDLKRRLTYLNKMKRKGCDCYGDDIDGWIEETENEIRRSETVVIGTSSQTKPAGGSKEKTAAVDDCDIIKNRSFAKDQPKRDWSCSELLKEIPELIHSEQWFPARDMANAIIVKQGRCPDFATKEQLDKAKCYKQQAETRIRK